MIKSTLAMLGLKAKDRITGFDGVVTSVSFDVYGCVQAVICPPAKDGKIMEGHWFDVKRLDIGESVMTPPNFAHITPGAEIGAAEKPAFY